MIPALRIGLVPEHAALMPRKPVTLEQTEKTMTTTAGYVRQIKHVLANDQHVVHNSPTVADLLRELADELEGLKKSEQHWVSECANMEMSRNRCREEIVRLRGALNQIAWPGAMPHPGIQTEREIAIDALSISKMSL